MTSWSECSSQNVLIRTTSLEHPGQNILVKTSQSVLRTFWSAHRISWSELRMSWFKNLFQNTLSQNLIVSNVSISGGRPLKINQSRQRVHRQTSDTSGVGDVSIKPPKIGSIYTRIQRQPLQTLDELIYTEEATIYAHSFRISYANQDLGLDCLHTSPFYVFEKKCYISNKTFGYSIQYF